MREKMKTMTLVCPPWLSFLLELPFRGVIHNPEHIVKPFVKNGDTVVDLGCGSGFFTIPMARMVGENGRVFAVDLQKKMLQKVERKAVYAQVEDRIVFHQCSAGRIGLGAQADFVLAFYMVHEIPDPGAFFREIKGFLAEGGKLLIVEPPIHVGKKKFARIAKMAEGAGLRIIGRPSIIGGRALLAFR